MRRRQQRILLFFLLILQKRQKFSRQITIGTFRVARTLGNTHFVNDVQPLQRQFQSTLLHALILLELRELFTVNTRIGNKLMIQEIRKLVCGVYICSNAKQPDLFLFLRTSRLSL